VAEILDKKESITVEESLILQSFEIASIVSFLEKKGLLKREEIIEEIRRLRNQWQKWTLLNVSIRTNIDGNYNIIGNKKI
jgi:hypothetical protein